MALKAVLDSLDGVDEGLQSLYAAGDDGRFRLQLEGAKTDDEIESLVKNRDLSLKQLHDLRQKLKNYEGIDPEEFKALREAKEVSERERMEKAGEFDKLKEQLVSKHEKELAKERERVKMLMDRLHEVMIDAEAGKILSSDKFRGSPVLLMPHIRTRAQVIEDGEAMKVVVLQKDGKTPMYANAKGDPATLEDLIIEMRGDDEFAAAFRASGATGSGAPATGGTNRSTGQGTVQWGDQEAFAANLEDIAKGKVKVAR